MLVQNKKAYYDYEIVKTYTAGIVLQSSEVKSIRNSDASINNSYIYVQDNEIFINGMYVKNYEHAKHNKHDEVRIKKLLLTKNEIRKIQSAIAVPGMTCVPLSIEDINGKLKIQFAVAKGKKSWDKRESIKERDIKIQTNRELNK